MRASNIEPATVEKLALENSKVPPIPSKGSGTGAVTCWGDGRDKGVPEAWGWISHAESSNTAMPAMQKLARWITWKAPTTPKLSLRVVGLAAYTRSMPADRAALLEAVSRHVRQVSREEVLPKFQNLRPEEVYGKANLEDPSDVVTAVDEAVEARLGPLLTALLPGSVVVGEEAAARDPSLLEYLTGRSPVWVIDPLDGTKNFVAGRPTFGTMVALVVDGETELSVIYLPESDALHAAATGVSAPPIKQPATGVTGKNGYRGVLHTHYLEASVAERLGKLSVTCDLVEPSGSAAITYAELVTGKLDFAFYGRLLPWDHAPGVFLVQQLGGLSQFLDGQSYAPTVSYGALLVARTETIWRAVRQWVG